MALIGRLEQFRLIDVIQRIESYAKTGALIVKQDNLWAEFYFREGKLMCYNPVPANITFGERLVRSGVISPQALQEAVTTAGGSDLSETRMAIMLMDMGHVTREALRTWVTGEVTGMLQNLLLWKTGNVYFEDDVQPPSERLLVALTATILCGMPAQQPVQQPVVPSAPVSPVPVVSPSVPEVPQATPSGLLSAADLVADVPPIHADAFGVVDTPFSAGADLFSGVVPHSVPTPLSPPMRVTTPIQPMRIDTSFMRPEMVLIPVDLSTLREQNPRVQITPDQWKVLTRVDGCTPLQVMCNTLAMPPEQVCQVAGELIAQGLVHISMPPQSPVSELSPISRDMITAGLSNGYVSPGYAATPAQPWGAMNPATGNLPSPTSSGPSLPFETQSQWGNGGNGATFVPGRGWVTAPQPLQPLQPGGTAYPPNAPMPPGGNR